MCSRPCDHKPVWSTICVPHNIVADLVCYTDPELSRYNHPSSCVDTQSA